MVDLKRKVEGNNNAHERLKNNSIILDEILDSQKYPFDKTKHGYKKEAKQSGVRTWILKKPEANTSSSRMEANSSSSKPKRKFTLQVFAQNIEDIRPRGHQGIDQGVGPTPQSRLRKETILGWNQISRYGNGFNGYCYSCNNYWPQSLGLQKLCEKECWKSQQLCHMLDMQPYWPY